MEPFLLQGINSQQRPTSTLLSVPHGAWEQRRPSQVSEMNSLITVGEYLGTQCDGITRDGASNYDISPNKKDQPFSFNGEGTIGSLASEIQLLSKKGDAYLDSKVTYPVFHKGGNTSADADEDLGELTSLSEMEISNVQDASLIQLERELFDTQLKL